MLRSTRAVIFIAALLAGCNSPTPNGSDSPSEQGLRSLASTTTAKITFANESGEEVKVYWLDFQGNRKLYRVLHPGESYDQETYLTHPWLITDSRENGLHVFFASTQPTVAHITPLLAKQAIAQ